MDPKIWGPNIWYTLHIISLYYPTNPTEFQKRAYHDFFINLKEVLPCSKCKDHYTKYVSEYPIYIMSCTVLLCVALLCYAV